MSQNLFKSEVMLPDSKKKMLDALVLPRSREFRSPAFKWVPSPLFEISMFCV